MGTIGALSDESGRECATDSWQRIQLEDGADINKSDLHVSSYEDRQPLIDGELRADLHGYMGGIIRKLRGRA